MFRHPRLISSIIVATVGLVGCGDDHRPLSPTAPSPSAAAMSQSGALASESEASESPTPRSGALHITKDCAGYTGLPGGFCVIVSSNVNQIPVGTRVVYASAATATAVDSDLMLDPPGSGESAASGHVVLDRVARLGTAAFSGGTGKFNHFSATVLVTFLHDRVWAWDGTYCFGSKDDRCDDE